MKKSLLVFMLGICVLSAGSYAVIFSDDFESGTLDQWDIIIEENGRGGGSEVVTRWGHQVAHIYKDGMHFAGISKIFDYHNDLRFSFDMETSVYSEAIEPDSASFAFAGLGFVFFDSNQGVLGKVAYRTYTSTYWESLITYNNNAIGLEEGFGSYVFNIQDVLSHITIEQNNIAYVNINFATYNSSNGYNMRAHVWVDNVLVTIDTPFEKAVRNTRADIAAKETAIEKIVVEIDKDNNTVDVLNEMLETDDFNNVAKQEIIKARQELLNRIQEQVKKKAALEESLESLYNLHAVLLAGEAS